MKRFLNNYRLFIFISIVLLLGVLILIFSIVDKEYSNDVLVTNYLFGSSDIVVSNSLPMTDVVGKTISIDNCIVGTTGYVEFEVKSMVDDKVKYEIYLTTENVNESIPLKFIKVFLSDEKDNALGYFDNDKLPTYYDLRLSTNDPSGRLIYSGYLSDKEKDKFKLRMWVADTYELTSNIKSFSVKLHVKIM